MAPVSVVTGANRGIGLKLCQRLQSKGYTVIAACRKPSTDLEALGVSIIQGVDVGIDGGCATLAAALVDRKVDLLVCNAGVYWEDTLSGLSLDDVRAQFEINTLGPLRTFQAVKGSLGRGSKVAIITSRMGSIADNTSGGDRRRGGTIKVDRPDTIPSYGYRMSKAAVNMLGANLAYDLKSDGVAVGILHPGFVATDMTSKYHGMDGIISPEKSAEDLVKVIEVQLKMETSGSFWHRDGSVLPW